MKSFASDNYAPVIPEIMDYLHKVNEGHTRSYGADPYTAALKDEFNALFGREVHSYLVFNGTGANLFGISSVLRPYEAIICTSIAHIHVDESTAPQLITGGKVQVIEQNDNGKLDPDKIKYFCQRKGDPHTPQLKVVSITQATECGTVYSLHEIREIKSVCDHYGLLLHMDGARWWNACIFLDSSLREMVADTGVDILSLGGTKSGAMGAEAVIFLNDEIASEAEFFHKRNTQLISKNRFIAAQFLALLQNDTWKKYAIHSNQMANRLANELSKFPEIHITQPVQSNGVFAVFPQDWIIPLQEIIPFYIWDIFKNEVRLMCSWDTSNDDIELLINGIISLRKKE